MLSKAATASSSNTYEDICLTQRSLYSNFLYTQGLDSVVRGVQRAIVLVTSPDSNMDEEGCDLSYTGTA